MLHLYETPRAPIDGFEVALINAFSSVRTVDAIWVREVQSPLGDKKYIRSVWLQLARRSLGDFRQFEALLKELKIRTLSADFELELHWVVDDLPPAVIAPSCVWRRAPLKPSA
jgi:hypothetical protein